MSVNERILLINKKYNILKISNFCMFLRVVFSHILKLTY